MKIHATLTDTDTFREVRFVFKGIILNNQGRKKIVRLTGKTIEGNNVVLSFGKKELKLIVKQAEFLMSAMGGKK